MPEQSSNDPWRPLIDLLVHLPVGAALEAQERYPKLVAAGRSHVETQTKLARFIGEYAVGVARRKAAAWWAAQASSTATATATAAPASPGDELGRPAESSSVGDTRALADGQEGAVEVAPAAEPATDAGAAGSHDVGSFPIVGYEELAAIEIVALLDRLGPADLDLVEEYETARRRRRTVLARIERLRRSAAGERAGLGAAAPTDRSEAAR